MLFYCFCINICNTGVSKTHKKNTHTHIHTHSYSYTYIHIHTHKHLKNLIYAQQMLKLREEYESKLENLFQNYTFSSMVKCHKLTKETITTHKSKLDLKAGLDEEYKKKGDTMDVSGALEIHNSTDENFFSKLDIISSQMNDTNKEYQNLMQQNKADFINQMIDQSNQIITYQMPQSTQELQNVNQNDICLSDFNHQKYKEFRAEIHKDLKAIYGHPNKMVTHFFLFARLFLVYIFGRCQL